MSENNPEDTGQISVAELLARNGQQTNLSTGGRRRRGVKGGISVAELTGEIPVVRDEPGSRSAPVVDAPAPPPADRDTPAPARVEADDDDRVTPDDAPAFLSSRPQPARPQSARPTAFQPVARREKQQPEPELLSGSTTVAGDLLNRSHDNTERGHRPAAPTTPPDRQPYGSTAAEQGRNRKPAGFTAPRQVEVAEPNTDVTPRAAVIDVDDVAKTAVSARIARPDDTESTPTGKVASTDEPATSAPTQAVDLVEPDAERDAEDNTAAAPETEADASPATRSGRRASAAKGKGGAVRQWLVLIGQAVVAIVVGALLFKGFEQLWDVLPWVALVLSVLVIVGLVAVVRILRRTDDLISIVIAIAVGVFVTLGPLAFQLSTG